MGALRKYMEYFGFTSVERPGYEDTYEEDREDYRSSYMSVDDDEELDTHEATVTPLTRSRGPAAAGPGGGMTKICQIRPTQYQDAKVVGNNLREGIPVIMNLSGVGEAEARRLVDFSAGLAYGVQGHLEKVTTNVFLLSPANVVVTKAEQKGSGGRGANGVFDDY